MNFYHLRMNIRTAALFLLLLALLANAAGAFSENKKAHANKANLSTTSVEVQWMGQIESRRLNESSGLAASNIHEDILWSINDSGGDAELFALTVSGEHVGRWPIDLPKPTDWEAMDSFHWRGKNYLLIADIGDNFAMRDFVSYIILQEPDVKTLADSAVLQPLVSQRFVYPGGPRDSEAIAVDPMREQILILSKRTKPPELYRLPLSSIESDEEQPQAAPAEQITASYVASLEGFDTPELAEVDFYGGIWEYLGMPTGMSIANNRLLVTTLEHAYLFNLDALEAPPVRLKLPFAGQREAIAFAKGRDDLAYVSHERRYGLRSADIYRLTLSPIKDDQPPSNEMR
ncbi:MAG: hypothetical protein ISP99_01440 [Pseudomonadales bacterium]|nr:hypothetical protein [Pseudomonadales bacterium]